jgi:hypothetical protein
MVEAYLGVDEDITEEARISELIIDVQNDEVVVHFVPPKMYNLR